MKIIVKQYFLLTIFLLFSGCSFQSKHEQKVEFVTQDGIVNPLIFKLLQLTDILYTDGTLSSVVDETQKHWLRKPGSERWDIQNLPYIHQQEIYKICKELKMFSEVKPEFQQYQYAFVLGGLFARMENRMAYLIDLWNQGVRFNSIIFLTGSRLANAAQGENQETLKQWANVTVDVMPQTETELLKFIYDHIKMPSAMRTLPVEIIDVPMLQNPDGTMRRANTADTIESWLKTNPKPGKILAVSNQPYVGYQNTVLKTLLPKSFEVDTVGQSCASNENIGVILDTLARTLYQEKLRIQNTNHSD